MKMILPAFNNHISDQQYIFQYLYNANKKEVSSLLMKVHRHGSLGAQRNSDGRPALRRKKGALPAWPSKTPFL